jgi:hypothetical protein
MYRGACACGKVSYAIQQKVKSVLACHCTTCQAWSGGVGLYLESDAKGSNVEVDGKDNLTFWKSSDYCERAFCKICGSSMFSRVTMAGPMEDLHHFAAGTLKNWDGIDHIETEIFIDRKPDAYSLTCDSKKMTSTEFFALCAGEGCDTKCNVKK